MLQKQKKVSIFLLKQEKKLCDCIQFILLFTHFQLSVPLDEDENLGSKKFEEGLLSYLLILILYIFCILFKLNLLYFCISIRFILFSI